MVGYTKELRTKQDYLNAVGYVQQTGTDKAIMITRLKSLKSNTTIMVLKKSSEGKDPEEHTQDDFEAVPDPNSEMARLGFTEVEIDKLIGGLK